MKRSTFHIKFYPRRLLQALALIVLCLLLMSLAGQFSKYVLGHGTVITKILFYGAVDGRLARSPARRYFSLIDAVVGGDQAGPLEPRARPEGALVAGFNPLSVDHVATQVMGFDPNPIRDQRRGAQLIRYRLTRSELPIRMVSRQPERRGAIQPGLGLNFEPHYAWKEYLQSFTSATD
jgi:hypothetical protein